MPRDDSSDRPAVRPQSQSRQKDASSASRSSARVRFAQIPMAALQDRRLTKTQLRVLAILLLHSYADKERRCWTPARLKARTIAEILDMPMDTPEQAENAVRAVKRARRDLEDLGYVKLMRTIGRSRAASHDVNPTWDKEAARAVAESVGGEEVRDQLSLGELPEKGDEVAPPSTAKGDSPATLSVPKGDSLATPLLSDSSNTYQDKRHTAGLSGSSRSITQDGAEEEQLEPLSHPDAGSPEIEYAWANAKAYGVTREAFDGAVSERPDLSASEINSTVCKWATRYGSSARFPDRSFAGWLRRERSGPMSATGYTSSSAPGPYQNGRGGYVTDADLAMMDDGT